jgi:hypothetical protein
MAELCHPNLPGRRLDVRDDLARVLGKSGWIEVTPGEPEPTPEERLLRAIFGENSPSSDTAPEATPTDAPDDDTSVEDDPTDPALAGNL